MSTKSYADSIMHELFGSLIESYSDRTLIVCHQHFLPSVLPLFSFLGNSIAPYRNIFVLGKPYSTIPNVRNALKELDINIFPNCAKYKRGYYAESIAHDIDKLWLAVRKYSNGRPIDNIIVLDEGGYLSTTVPKDLQTITIAIEQTTSGSFPGKDHLVPTIEVSLSNAKLSHETPIISKAIWKKYLRNREGAPPDKVGIIGLGNIGLALAMEIVCTGTQVNYYDLKKNMALKNNMIQATTSVKDLVRECDLVFGCTGTDSVSPNELAGKKVTLISTSSGDVEFSSILKTMNGKPTEYMQDDLLGSNELNNVKILNGGFPYNFDRKYEHEKYQDILLTRLLMLAGVRQALNFRETNIAKGSKIVLDEVSQQEVVEKWFGANTNHKWGCNILVDSKEKIEESQNSRNYKLHWTTPLYLEKVKAHKESYTYELFGKELIICPGVMSPKYDWAGHFMIEEMPDVKGKKVLEIGSGCGLVSVFACINGASHVTAVDINTEAVNNTEQNLQLHCGNSHYECGHSDMFFSIEGKFDVIMFNAPYHGCKPLDDLEQGVADESYRSLRIFFKEVGKYMAKDCIVVVGFSDSGDLKLFKYLHEMSGLQETKFVKDTREDYECELSFFV